MVKQYKFIIVSIILMSSVFIGGLTYMSSLHRQLAEAEELITVEKTTYPEIYNELDSITVSSFSKKVTAGESFSVYVGRPTCGDCTNFEPEFIEMVKERELTQVIDYLNVAQLRNDEPAWESFKKEYNILYTPTLVIFEAGEIAQIANWTPESGINKKEFEECLDIIARG